MTHGDRTDWAIEETQEVCPASIALTSALIKPVTRFARSLEADLDDIAIGARLNSKDDSHTWAAVPRCIPKHESSSSQLAESVLISTGAVTGRLDRLEVVAVRHVIMWLETARALLLAQAGVAGFGVLGWGVVEW